jgi:hypothetical protein
MPSSLVLVYAALSFIRHASAFRMFSSMNACRLHIGVSVTFRVTTEPAAAGVTACVTG